MTIEHSDNSAYMGNTLLKSVGVEQEWSEEDLAEYIKCEADPVYFAEKYCKIIHVDYGLINYIPYDYQKELIKKLHNNRFNIAMQARQTGKSTTVAAYILHYVLFNQSKTVGILANKKETAVEILGRVQTAYENLPKFIQQGVKKWNTGSFELENGSRVLAAATSSSAIRGYSFSYVFIDEVAFIPPTVWDEFYRSTYPTISSGKETKVTLISTPAGMNHFYKLWTDADAGRSSYVTHMVAWDQVPGRDEAWKNETIRNTSEQDFAQEHGLSFLGSANTLISTWKLKQMGYVEPLYENNELKVYEKPRPGGVYVMVCDIAEGVGGDYSTLSVIDISNGAYKLVAIYRNNKISTLLFPDIIYKVGTEYNSAYVLIEVNSIGKQVADVLHAEFEYENILMSTSGGGRGGQTISSGFGGSGGKLGVKTTQPLRRIGCSMLKNLIEENKLIIPSYDVIHELSTFVFHKGKYQAEVGAYDDLVMTLVLFSWLTQQSYFRDLLDINIRTDLYKDKIKQIEESLVPFGFVDAGDGVFDDDDDGIWQKADFVKM